MEFVKTTYDCLKDWLSNFFKDHSGAVWAGEISQIRFDVKKFFPWHVDVDHIPASEIQDALTRLHHEGIFDVHVSATRANLAWYKITLTRTGINEPLRVNDALYVGCDRKDVMSLTVADLLDALNKTISTKRFAAHAITGPGGKKKIQIFREGENWMPDLIGEFYCV